MVSGQTERPSLSGLRTAYGNGGYVRRTVLGKQTKEGESPVVENRRPAAVSRVPRDTRNPVGSRGDHPPSLNTP